MQLDTLHGAIVDSLSDGLYFVDRERKILVWNKAAERITGFSRDEVTGSMCQMNLLNHIDAAGTRLCIEGCPLHATMQDGVVRRAEVFLQHKKGHRVPIHIHVLPVRENGEIIGAAELFTDQSNSESQQELVGSLTLQLMTDQLTGLSNRRFGESYLESAVQAHAKAGETYGVVFIDLDNFSACNNRYGHPTGDAMLVSVAESLRVNVREGDVICRWGGEEFLGIFAAKNTIEAYKIAEKLRVLVENSTMPGRDSDISVTASIGVTTLRQGDTPESVVARADALMYQSKRRGKNCVTGD